MSGTAMWRAPHKLELAARALRFDFRHRLLAYRCVAMFMRAWWCLERPVVQKYGHSSGRGGCVRGRLKFLIGTRCLQLQYRSQIRTPRTVWMVHIVRNLFRTFGGQFIEPVDDGGTRSR